MNLSPEHHKTTEIWLIRHAETVGSRVRLQDRIFQDMHTPLSEHGHAQAQRLAERLQGRTFAMLFSSTAIRALETAQYVSNAVGLEIQEDERLRETGFGAWIGLSRREVAERHPADWAAFQRRDPNYHFGGGESFADTQRGVVTSIEEVTKQCSGQRAIIISSQGAIRLYLANVLGLPPTEASRLEVDHTSISRAHPYQTPPSKSEGLPGILLALNDTTHLEGLSEN